jgi:hypothetical protein
VCPHCPIHGHAIRIHGMRYTTHVMPVRRSSRTRSNPTQQCRHKCSPHSMPSKQSYSISIPRNSPHPHQQAAAAESEVVARRDGKSVVTVTRRALIATICLMMMHFNPHATQHLYQLAVAPLGRLEQRNVIRPRLCILLAHHPPPHPHRLHPYHRHQRLHHTNLSLIHLHLIIISIIQLQ